MPVIEIQRVPGEPKERVQVSDGTIFYDWLCAQSLHDDVDIVINGRKLNEVDELGFPLQSSHNIQIFDQPKSVISDILSPIFKVVSKVFSFLTPKQSASVADSNTKESPNNRLTGQTNVARTYQARPDIFGQVRAYPDLIQQSMFEYINNLKQVTEWMNFGIGKFTVENVRYSESTLGSLAGASYQIYQPGENIPVIYEGFEFDDVDGQELPGPNESADIPIESATANTVVAGVFSGGQISMQIVKQAEFDYFYGLSFPHAVTLVINVSYNTASGPVTTDITVNANLIDAAITNNGSPTTPIDYYTFYFSDLSGSDAETTPSEATINNTTFILNDNQPLVVGPFFAPVDGDQLWVHLNAQLGKKDYANTGIRIWKVDEANNQIPGTMQYFQSGFSAAPKTDNYYLTYKITPAAGRGRYALQFDRLENSNDHSILKLEEIHSVRIRINESHPDDTLVKVSVRATEQATGSRERKYNALITRHTISYSLGTRTVDYTLRRSRSFADAVAHEWLVIGKQPESTIDLYELYSIANSLPNPNLGYFDYTFDDEDISLGSRIETICNVARVIAYWDDGVMTFARDERKEFPSAVFNRANIIADEYKITYDMTMPGGYDGVEVEYVSPTTNKKTYIRYRVTNTGIIEQTAQNPLKVSLSGCRNEYQARDRALLEVNRLFQSRMKMTMKTLADGEYISPGEMIVVADTYDTNQQAGYIVARNENNFDTSEQITFSGDMYVRVTDSLGNSTAKIIAYPRSDTKFGFIAAIPNINLNIFDGYNVQSPSRYVIATTEEMESMRWRVTDKKPNADGTYSITCDEYFDSKIDYNV
ncbi:MoaD/ThiS family protein [Budviciaceae bacterium CWB-B4]|uniref:MoaD/ThiS family protein n=1 Tax=Limnobaculum xujianqingii TaxID=2738837 RepID=A0A9D7FZI4_9GAMM|nr:host specificity factor TipJ family phage tail protein [Limnobaculum xujianqingii]MBK5074593.1 MoaD/ThiS family protein [Limnobaculum xujianqingii]MBK5177741.1 MoaD/ThiS family protein [Limnobaculum xujianqingii]